MRFFLIVLFALLGNCCLSHAQISDYVTTGGLASNRFSADTSLLRKVAVRHIIIAGNKSTRDRIITREMSIAPGDSMLRDSLDILMDLNKKRLVNLSLFTDVTVTPARVAPGVVDIFVLVKEQWYIFPEIFFQLADRNFNVWIKEQGMDIRRVNLGVTLKHRNFRGNMETLGVSGQIGYTQKLGLEYFKPYLDKNQRHGAGFSISKSDNNEIYYTTDSNKLRFVRAPHGHVTSQLTTAVQYVYRPRYATRHLLELRYRDQKVDDTLVGLNPDYFSGSHRLQHMELTYKVEYNKTDNWNYPMQGFRAIGQSVTRWGFRGMRFQHYNHLEMGRFVKWGKKWYTSNVFRGRITFPEDQPYVYRNALGTNNEYIRGYEYYVIDGSQYALGRATLKYELVNFSLVNIPVKYLPTVPIRIYPKVYADAGYVSYKYPGNSFLNNRPLYSAGVGVDFVSAYDFKIRVEYSWNHLGENGLFLHTSFE